MSKDNVTSIKETKKTQCFSYEVVMLVHIIADKETDVIEGGRSARAGRGVNNYDKHLDQNLKNKPTPEKKTRR